MRILIDIPDRLIEDLTVVCEREKRSQAEVILSAISMYVGKKKISPDNAFGLWKGKQTDGLAYQEQVRSEW
jgi:metal-responsive CopG/Arc/MetJ family transcriptional regulator